MITTVARLYRFRARHSVPDLPAPWCEPHEHDYTVEVACCVASREPVALVIDTDKLDQLWQRAAPGPDLDAMYGATNTTVEALAHRWLAYFRANVTPRNMVQSVTVWEDDSRWGQAA